jgi:hypothetical protein
MMLVYKKYAYLRHPGSAPVNHRRKITPMFRYALAGVAA